jgi:protein kinase C substrate 80K-H
MALKSLRREYKKHREREQLLGSILETLSSGYNPNYQDMAVLEAVRGWQQLSGTGKGESPEEGSGDGTTPTEEEIEVGLWNAHEIERDLDALLETDYVSLLLAHEEHIRSSPSESPRTRFSFLLESWLTG